MPSNKLWSALTHYNDLIIKYKRKYKTYNIQSCNQRISPTMQFLMLVCTHSSDPTIHHAITIELHRKQIHDGPHSWYDYRVLARQSDFIPDVHNTEWKTLEEIIIGGDE